MSDETKKILLAGIGAAALTCEKASEAVTNLVKKGKLSVEEGKELSQELTRNMTEKGTETKDVFMEKVENLKPLTKEGLKEILQEMNYATKAEVVELKRRIEVLEAKLNSKEETTQDDEVK